MRPNYDVVRIKTHEISLQVANKPTPQFRGSGLHTSIQKPLRLICLYTKIVATINVTIPNDFTYIELNFNISILKAVPIIGIKKSIAISISKIPNIIC